MTSRISILILFALLHSNRSEGHIFSFDQFQLSRTCHISGDQRGSLRAPLLQRMKLIVDNRFNKDQKKEIAAAAETWNQAGRHIMGQNFFIVMYDDIPDAVATAHDFDCGLKFGGADFTYIVNVNASLWKKMGLPYDSSTNLYAPGVTHDCASPSVFFEEAVEFNTDGLDAQQFPSYVVHELGHALGLKHSCAGKPDEVAPDYVSCSKISSGHPYHAAVMYPSLRKRESFSTPPEQKMTLSENDLSRLECLYGAR